MWPRGVLQPEDAELRFKACLALTDDCDLILLPPVYETLLLQSEDSDYKKYKEKIVPLFTALIQNHILPFSIVGKIGLIGYTEHQEIFANHWRALISNYVPTDHQSNNKYYQKQLPIYPIPTDHWSILYDLPRTWFVNKLIKEDLRKFEDYAIDTVLPLDRGYLKYWKVIKQKFHNKIRRYDEKVVFGLLDSLLETFETGIWSSYSVQIIYTGKLPLERNKTLKWALQRGKSTDIDFLFHQFSE